MANEGTKTLLVVDDEEDILLMMEDLLSGKYDVITATDGRMALDIINAKGFSLDLVIIDIMMPNMDGMSLLREIKANFAELGIMMMSAYGTISRAIEAMHAGAYDYITKPLPEFDELDLKIQRYFERRELERQLREYERNKEYAIIFGLAKLAESRDPETGGHLRRIGSYCRILAEQLATIGKYAKILTPDKIENLVRSSSLHDIGKVGIPDSILLKPAPLTSEEWKVMKTHTTIGGQTLATSESVLNIGDKTFLSVGRDIAYYHHEWYNGEGYPFGRTGEDIPLAARLVAVADGYDAMRSNRPYKGAFPHEKVKAMIVEDKGKRYHPDVADAFLDREVDFVSVQRNYTED